MKIYLQERSREDISSKRSQIIRGKVIPDKFLENCVIGTMEAKVILHHAYQTNTQIRKREIQLRFVEWFDL